MNQFFQDVWQGLNTAPKHLSSKYFYDEKGDKLFQDIMDCPEYYLTRCELEIFTKQTARLSALILSRFREFDLVEMGAGDCFKSIHLLNDLQARNANFTYYPIDISKNVIAQLNRKLPKAVPGLKMRGLNGEYFDMLEKAHELSDRNKVILFLGSSIGNFPYDETAGFFKELRTHLQPGDLMIIGFDLKKDPKVILDAYNDKGGITRNFNLNLLHRINNELDADFDVNQFDHCPEYDENTGACKSYLKSRSQQRVRIGEEGWVHFSEGERIYMEISQKYTVEQTDQLAHQTGFAPVHHFFDSKEWFLDTAWQCV